MRSLCAVYAQSCRSVSLVAPYLSYLCLILVLLDNICFTLCLILVLLVKQSITKYCHIGWVVVRLAIMLE